MPKRLLLVCLLASLPPFGAARPAPTRSAADPTALRLPAAGDCTLQILSPSILELTHISAPEPASAWAKLKHKLGDRPSPPPSASPAFVVTVDGRPVKVDATGLKRRVLYAPVARRDLRIATHHYLRLTVPLAPREPASRVEVRETDIVPGQPALAASATFDPLRTSPAIHVNQEGYVPALPKQAMIGCYLGDLGEMEIPAAAGFTLIAAHSGAAVFRGPLVSRPDIGYTTTPLPYQKVFVADFSAFTTPGEYRLQVPGLGVSLPFLVDAGIALGFARTYALGLYHQRCGTSNALPFTRFTHDACHLAPAQIPTPQSDPRFAFTWATVVRAAREASPDNPPQTAAPLLREEAQLYPFVNRGPVGVSGGHHDAGDYSKYTINSAALVHYLVFAADAIPGVAALDRLGLPESGDGIGDVLQEAKWEADFLAKLQDADGGFYFLVYPQARQYEANVLPDRGDPQVVWPKNTAATAAAVAALAQCASSPHFRRHFPAAAAQYLRQARHGWQFLIRAIARHGKAGAWQKITFYGDHYTHDDELAWAACELFLATGEAGYREKLYAWFPNPADPATRRWGWWRLSEGWGNAIRSYAFAARSGRLPAAALDARHLRICEGEILAAADDVLGWARQNAYGTPFPLPTKAVRGAGWYFSLDQASDLAVAWQLDPQPAFLAALVGALNFEGGCNPVNVTFLTGLGTHRQREVVHQYAQNDRRVLPPSGLPLGNLQTAFQHLPPYGAELRAATYPDDNAATGPYPFYDRWSDAFNVTTEFIAVNQARSLLATAFLATLSPAATEPESPIRAKIVVPAGTVPLLTPVTFRVQVTGRSAAGARIVWEARDQEPVFGATATFVPRNNGPHWIEVELAWPDGRRAFAAGTFDANAAVVGWLDDTLPDGAEPAASGGDGWNWIATHPAPQSGTKAHQSNLAAGLHEHWFRGASATLAVGPGDSLFAWVFLDPKNPPTEIMLMWHDGASWEHRAFWGANTITYGALGSAGRFPAGPLPPAGRWVRLEVSARAVGLEGITVSGMGFAQFDGRATWDAAGRTGP